MTAKVVFILGLGVLIGAAIVAHLGWAFVGLLLMAWGTYGRWDG